MKEGIPAWMKSNKEGLDLEEFMGVILQIFNIVLLFIAELCEWLNL